MAIRCEGFEPRHLDEAQALACRSYDAARERIPALPADAVVPHLDDHARSGMGVVAWDGDRLVGYLAGVPPFDGMFGPVMGTYAPLEAQAVDPDLPAAERRHICSRLYEAAAERWVGAGVLSHAVVVYADDRPAVDSLFWNGLGLRTLDAIRLLEPLTPTPASPMHAGLTLSELPPDEYGRVVPLYQGLIAHLRASPSLMAVEARTAEQLAEVRAGRPSRIVGIARGTDLVGYLEVTDVAETFVTLVPGMPNICGAYLLPEYRGGDVAAALLDFLIAILRRDGYTHLGVDFEGFNPTASGFWLKYFTPYTFGMTRRLDERIVTRSS